MKKTLKEWKKKMNIENKFRKNVIFKMLNEETKVNNGNSEVTKLKLASNKQQQQKPKLEHFGSPGAIVTKKFRVEKLPYAEIIQSDLFKSHVTWISQSECFISA